LLRACVAGASANAEDYVARGKAKFATGDFSGALEEYHSACDVDPTAYMNFYRRATVYLATGRTRQAEVDLSKVLDIRPDMKEARKTLAELRVKAGSYSDAKADYELLKDAANVAVVVNAEALVKGGDAHKAAGRYPEAIDMYTQAIEFSPGYITLRMSRAHSYEATAQYGEAIGDVIRAVKLKSGNVKGHFLLSRLHYKTGDREEALKSIREAVKLDDNFKEAMDFYKMLKKFNKVMVKLQKSFEQQRMSDVIQEVQKARELEMEKTFVYQDELNEKLCKALKALSKVEEAMEACNVTIALNPKSIEAYIVRSEIYQDKGEFQSAIDDLKVADGIEENNQRIKELVQKAEKLLKQSMKRDYYKILGVDRTAGKKEITKAYRKLAMEWHPDKHPGEEEKKVAENKFMDIAAAKEVLTDEKMKRQFDQGEDPLDAEQERERQQGGHNPFGGGQRFHFRHG
jgi:DnaJ homolog subfamily C member 3